MRARALLPLLALCGGAAGCFDDHGVVLEIDTSATPEATQVELFLTDTECTTDPNCQGITALEGGPHLTGEVWYRDKPARLHVDLAGATKAKFRLEAGMLQDGETEETVSKVIAIGLDRANAPVGVQTTANLVIPTTTGKLVSMSLKHTSALASNGQGSGVLFWTTPDGAASPRSCVLVAKGDGAGNTERTFVVPDDDLDCDGKPDTADCAPNVYLGGDGSIADTNDLTNTCADQTADACVVGALACFPGDEAGCRPQVDGACLPSEMCNQCEMNALSTCQMNWMAMPHVDCAVPLADDSACSHDSADLVLNVTDTEECDTAKIAAIDGGHIGVFGDKAEFSGAELGVSTVNMKKQCAIKLSWQNSATQPPATQYGLIRVGNKKSGNTIVPLIVRFGGPITACANRATGFACASVVPMLDHDMWSCLAQPAAAQ